MSEDVKPLYTTSNPLAEVTFKYYLPEHNDEVWIHINASEMYSLLWELDQKCRSICKYEDIPEDHPRHKLAQEIRDMIWENVNLDKVR